MIKPRILKFHEISPEGTINTENDLKRSNIESGILQEIRAELILEMNKDEVEEFIRLISGFENLKSLKIHMIDKQEG